MRWGIVLAWVGAVASACSSSSSGGGGTGGNFCGAVSTACHVSSTQSCDDVLKADGLNYPSCTSLRDPFLACMAGKSMVCPDSSTVYAGAGTADGFAFQLGGYTAYTDSGCADLGDKWYACENPVTVTCIKNAAGCKCSTSSQTPGTGDTVVASCDAGPWQCCNDLTSNRYSSTCSCSTYGCLQKKSVDDCECRFATSAPATGDVAVSTCTSSLKSLSGQAETLCCQDATDKSICGCTSYYADCASWVGGVKVTGCAKTATLVCPSSDAGPVPSCDGLHWR
ncbi:MAG TPA: hypothetical protein VIF15_15725 [Polyangiaceae bacterium]